MIEPKRNQSSDQTLGQALRYIGGVREHLANPEDEVEGLIIAHEANERLHYALKAAPMQDATLIILHLPAIQLTMYEFLDLKPVIASRRGQIPIR